MLRLYTSIATILLAFALNAQEAKHCFVFGEQVKYDIYYNWQFIWLQAGEVTFSTNKKVIDGENYYHFHSQGGTLPNYDWIYHVNDTYESYASTKNMNPYWALRNVHEGKTILYNQHYFNYNDSTIVADLNIKNKQQAPDTLKITKQTFDVLTAIYYCRNIDFANIKINDTIPVTVTIDNELFDLHIRYLGKQVLKHRNDKTYHSIKFSVLLVEGTIFTGGEEMFVWVSDDANRIPIHIEAKILVGSIKAYLNEAKDYKNSSEKY